MMTTGMTHDQARDALEALALDLLDASERRELLTHVETCALCREELSAIEATVGELAYAAAPIAMSPAQRDRIRARLLVRATADRSPVVPIAVPVARVPVALVAAAVAATHEERTVSPMHQPALVPQPRLARSMMASASRGRWMAMAASVIAVLSIAQLARVSAERNELRDLQRIAALERGARTVAIDSLKSVVLDRDRMIANLTGPEVAVVTLAATKATAPSARMFWDQSVDAWTFVAHNLSAPKPGRTYQLWLVTPTAKISAGTFTPAANGDAVVRAKYALPKNALAAVAVTEEPSAGSEQPTTTPFIVAVNKGVK